jgi:hypothetical protein
MLPTGEVKIEVPPLLSVTLSETSLSIHATIKILLEILLRCL